MERIKEGYRYLAGKMIFGCRFSARWYVPLLLTLVMPVLAVAQQRVAGRVVCEGKGVKDVVVSCGAATVRTNARGQYVLYPDAGEQFVQISVPSGYKVHCDTTIPRFYKKIETAENTYDFALIRNPVNDNKHVFFAQADVQVTSQEDLAAYRKEVVGDMLAHLDAYRGQDVFGIDLGDMVGDMPGLFPDYIHSMAPLNIPFYRAIGNHDMAYWGRSFETSERIFNDYFGPTVFSFNKGKAHYIVLNNNFYVGRDYFYMGYIDERTFRWLQQDLSYVPKGSIVFVMMHIPTQLQKAQQPFAYDYSTIADQTVNAAALHKVLEGYNTHIISGHMHYNLNVVYNDSLYEHNTAAACATWWQAPVCLDGTPRGYAVYEVEGNSVKWHYKSAGFDQSHQFRSYYQQNKDTLQVIANVWNYDDKWKVEWLENGELIGTMKPFSGFDPLAYAYCSDKEKIKYGWISPIETAHLFKAVLREPGAKMQVRVTDRFGRVYLEEVKKDK